ncbi:MAG: DUF1850 domain-containing protein [Desulfobacteraceae bacterium]|nr:DUF1850 domain-containing protein [Desulfobacteraceae bacterium]
MAGGKIAGVAATVLLAAVIFWAGTRPAVVFTVRLPREGDRLAAAVRTGEGEEMRLSYLHSVEKTPVEGRFVVSEGPSLRIRETRMASVGTGLPNTVPERTRREGGWLVVDEEMHRIEGFRYRLMDLNRTRLTVEGAPVPLGEIRNGSILYFSVESVRNFRWWLWCITGTDWKAPDLRQEAIRERTG